MAKASVVAFDDQERLIGNAAKEQVPANFGKFSV